MFKKGQAAMEFLMTYGWAILVVLAAIAALAYFGVLNPAGMLPERCVGPSGLDCVEKAGMVADNISWATINNLGYDISITGVEETADSDCGVNSRQWNVEGAGFGNASAATAQNGEVAAFKVVCDAGLPNDRVHAEFNVHYTSITSGVDSVAFYTMDIRR